MVEHLTRLLDSTTVMPAVNQIEVHPYFQQRGVQEFGHRHGILTQAWSPIGGITFYRDSKHSSTLEDPVILDIAKAHSKSPAQSPLRKRNPRGLKDCVIALWLREPYPRRRRPNCWELVSDGSMIGSIIPRLRFLSLDEA
jgi:hypothetical protein